MKYVVNFSSFRQNEFVNLFVYFIENFERFKLFLFKLFIAFRSNVFVSQSNAIFNDIFHEFYTNVRIFLLFCLCFVENLLQHFDEFIEIYRMLFNEHRFNTKIENFFETHS